MGSKEAKAFDKVFKEQNPPEFICVHFYNPKNGQVEWLTSTHKDRQSFQLGKTDISNIKSSMCRVFTYAKKITQSINKYYKTSIFKKIGKENAYFRN